MDTVTSSFSPQTQCYQSTRTANHNHIWISAHLMTQTSTGLVPQSSQSLVGDVTVYNLDKRTLYFKWYLSAVSMGKRCLHTLYTVVLDLTVPLFVLFFFATVHSLHSHCLWCCLLSLVFGLDVQHVHVSQSWLFQRSCHITMIVKLHVVSIFRCWKCRTPLH